MEQMKYLVLGFDIMDEKGNGSIVYYNQKYLFPLSYEDLSMIKDWRNSQMEILRQWKPLTDANQERWYQIVSDDQNQVIFSIKEYNELNHLQLTGYCGITNIDYINHRGEISFLVDPTRACDPELYRTYFSTVLYLLCQYGFDELNLHKMFTETFDFREEHIKILEDFGFRKDGIMREHHYTKGNYWNSVIHSIIQNEWKKKRRVE